MTEIAAYTARDDMTALQADVHAGLRGLEGAYPVLASRAFEDARAMLDLIGWRDAATQGAAPKKLVAANPALGVFFDQIETMHVFELFEVVA